MLNKRTPSQLAQILTKECREFMSKIDISTCAVCKKPITSKTYVFIGIRKNHVRHYGCYEVPDSVWDEINSI